LTPAESPGQAGLAGPRDQRHWESSPASARASARWAWSRRLTIRPSRRVIPWTADRRAAHRL